MCGRSSGAPKNVRAAHGPSAAVSSAPGRPTAATASNATRSRDRRWGRSARSAPAVNVGSRNACTGPNRNTGMRASTNSDTKLAATSGAAGSRAVSTSGAVLATT